MRALVTGASGFVAGWLIRHLRDSGDAVVGIDESIDIGDGDALRRAVTDAAPEAIYHLAAFTHVGRSWEQPREVFRVNAVGTLELLQAALACDRLSRQPSRPVTGGAAGCFALARQAAAAPRPRSLRWYMSAAAAAAPAQNPW